MEESLKSGRLLHRTLILLSGVILIFAFSAKPSIPFDKILEELDTLVSADLGGVTWEKYEAWYSQQLNEQVKVDSQARAIEETLGDLDCSFDPISRTPSDYIRIGWPAFVGWGNAPLKEYTRFFEDCSDDDVVYLPDTESLKASLQRLPGEVASSRVSAKGTLGVRDNPAPPKLDSLDDVKVTSLIWDFSDHETPSWVKSSQAFYSKIGVVRGNVTPFVEGPGLHSGSSDIHIGTRGRAQRIPKASYKWWLQTEHEPTSTLAQQKEFFPASRKVWASIKDLPPEDAITEVKEMQRAAPPEEEIKILGVAIPAILMTIAGPVILIGLCFYLVAHAIHIHGQRHDNEQLLRSFPWVVLFNDAISRGVTFFTLVLLPICADVCLVLSLWNANEPWKRGVAIALAITVIGLSVFTWALLRALRTGATWISRFGAS